jgi:NAD-dependent dihydropyrimidine dehydrogenase PreA subunit
MGKTRNIVEIDEELCDGCGKCALSCAEGALEIRNGKARLISESYCDGLGACISDCPKGAVRVIEREAEEFDPEAVEARILQSTQAGQKSEKHREAGPVCACPSTLIGNFAGGPLPARGADAKAAHVPEPGLSNWPIQVRLVSPDAPFLKGADLLVVSDCAPAAYPNFHRRFVDGKVVLLGCPKFDNAQEYIKKFTEIFRIADISSVTVIDMEVPCCSVLPAIVRRGVQEAGKDIVVEEVVISIRGEVLGRDKNAA